MFWWLDEEWKMVEKKKSEWMYVCHMIVNKTTYSYTNQQSWIITLII